MKLWHISQHENNGYDTYDSAVVAAPDEETARQMNPEDGKPVIKWAILDFADPPGKFTADGLIAFPAASAAPIALQRSIKIVTSYP